MSQLAILDGIRIASPCSASWEGMAGDDRVRSCSACGKDVYNIGSMTTAEAIALMAGRGESTPCVRFYRRPDGTILTSDCPVGSGRARRRRRFAQVAGLGMVGLAFMATGASAVGLRRGPIDPMPSGPGKTLDDWIDWALVAVGVRSRSAVTVGMPAPISPQIGEPAACPAAPPARVLLGRPARIPAPGSKATRAPDDPSPAPGVGQAEVPAPLPDVSRP